MNYLKERVAYLKGLADGMQISDSTNEGRLLKAIIEVLDDMAMTVDDIEEVQEQLSEQVDIIDEDLGEVEKVLFEEEEEEEECDDEDCLGEVECPNCNETICIEEDMFSDDGDTLKCPHCGEKIDVDWCCDCEDCDDEEHKH